MSRPATKAGRFDLRGRCVARADRAFVQLMARRAMEGRGRSAAGAIGPIPHGRRDRTAAEGIFGTPGPWSRTIARRRAHCRALRIPDGGIARRVADVRCESRSLQRRSSSGLRHGPARPAYRQRSRAPRLDEGIFHQLLDELVEPDRVAAQGVGVAFGARDLQQLADQSVEAIGFLLNAVERGFGIVAGACEFDGDAEARQGRPQFVGDIQKQAAFGGEQRFQAVGHAVEGAGELAELVAAHTFSARRKIAAAEALHGLLQAAHGG